MCWNHKCTKDTKEGAPGGAPCKGRSGLRPRDGALAVPDPMVAFEGCAGADFVCDTFSRSLVSKLRAKLS